MKNQKSYTGHLSKSQILISSGVKTKVPKINCLVDEQTINLRFDSKIVWVMTVP
jgi:hypothetical protein